MEEGNIENMQGSGSWGLELRNTELYRRFYTYGYFHIKAVSLHESYAVFCAWVLWSLLIWSLTNCSFAITLHYILKASSWHAYHPHQICAISGVTCTACDKIWGSLKTTFCINLSAPGWFGRCLTCTPLVLHIIISTHYFLHIFLKLIAWLKGVLLFQIQIKVGKI